ncbi:MAG: C40 family peptidase [Candidatus Aminicenantes bacterium]|nr:MAG: C40 family peptidase [Candidatus Aminicenantes bacterium]
MGYAIQVGAFSAVDNAIKLNKSLRRKGLNAYYFAHPSGLYKVRFGDFRTKKAAEKKAKRLVKAGIIDEYYIVAPEEYAVAQEKKFGKQYLRSEIVATAKRFLGIPYAWGGASPSEGFDCSGLTMTVYRINGLNLPHSSRAQYKTGTPVSKSRLRKGDLVFFATRRGRRVSHVGIYTGNNQFIHAPGNNKRVQTESLSNSYFRENYVGARTYLR